MLCAVGAAACAPAPNEPQVPGRYRGFGSAHQIRRDMPGFGGRGKELLAAAPGTSLNAGASYPATQTHTLRRGALCRYSHTHRLIIANERAIDLVPGA